MTVQQWIDKSAIQELIHRHSDAITRGDLGALEGLYAFDAVWETPLVGIRFETARAFFDFLAESMSTNDLVIQTVHNPVVRLVDDTKAKATTTVFERAHGVASVAYGDVKEGDEFSVAQYGVYYDNLSKSTGQWLFTHRLFAPCYMEQGAAGGDVLTERSSLIAP